MVDADMVIVLVCGSRIRARFFFPRLHIALVLYDFAICERVFCVRVLVLTVCILVMQRPGVCSLCLYSLDAPFRTNKIHPLSKKTIFPYHQELPIETDAYLSLTPSAPNKTDG